MKLDLISNTFKNNKGLNGGALYLSNGINTKTSNNYNNKMEKKDKITIENNVFVNNCAENFGGAIYSNYNKLYLASSLNNTISYNTAKSMGGGIYVLNSVTTNIFDMKNWTIYNNTVNSYIDNYSSNPAYLILDPNIPKTELSIVSGNFLPLNFTLYDHFNKTIVDISRYYSSLELHLTLKSESEINGKMSNEKEDSTPILIENTGAFLNGNIRRNLNRVIYL